MECVSALEDTREGDCLLIGGGCSVNSFDWYNLRENVDRVSINRCFIDTRIDYMIYCDPFFLRWLEGHPIGDGIQLVGWRGNTCDRTDYWYHWEEHFYQGFHSGYTGLQFCQYLGYDRIFLIGFDYHDTEKGLHYYEGQYDTQITELEKRTIKSNMDKWLSDFDRAVWTAEIINLNPDSRLKKFNFGGAECLLNREIQNNYS